jgi:hypothetical protein
VLPLVPQQRIELVVIPRKGALAGVPLPEGKGLGSFFRLAEPLGVQQNARFPALGAAAKYKVPTLQATKLLDGDFAVFIHGEAVHTALAGKEPPAAHPEILGVDAGGMVPLGSDAVRRGGTKRGVRRALQRVGREIGRVIDGKLKGHRGLLF